MRQAMAAAEVGDDVIDVDPTVAALERATAERLGKEAALFMPSGTMSNQVALRVHCQSGDEFLCEAGCHIYNYEQGGFAQLSGLVPHTFVGDRGVLTVEQLHGQVRADNEHLVRTRLLTLENTHNRGGGTVLPYDGVMALCRWARQEGLRTHLDGARLFNAVVATGIEANEWSQGFDTVSVCFSKGLGAPVGSALAGPRELIRLARRHRKLLGGGMRQAGVIAAAALYALQHHVSRLRDDHALAQQLADGIASCPGLSLSHTPVATNIVLFHVASEWGTAAEFTARLAAQGVHMLPFGGTQVRAVTHLDVTSEQIDRAVTSLRQLTGG
jgi:threonine aldolase